eukprot:Nitzschia sp. Nitz4//scaffold10_size219509//135486//136841//NITZ4_001440-RA/size219509-processed-gene-0.137-mRNA-1//-1//CDS//3329532956//7897//frame0
MARSQGSRNGRQDAEQDVEQASSQPFTPPRMTAPRDEVSPAGTFDTAVMSPASFDGEEDRTRSAEKFQQKVVIEHNVKSGGSRNRSAALMLGMTKPAMAIVGLLVLGGASAAALGWFQIPGLENQIAELEAQVAELSTQIDRLSEENDRYEELNNDLNQTVADFRDLNENLNNTVTELEGISYDLNMTNQQLTQQVNNLAQQNEDYRTLNDELNETATRLEAEVEFFEVALARLVLENGALANTTEALQGALLELGNITDAQNQTLTELSTVLTTISDENDRLSSLNDNLVTIVSFLNDTSTGLEASLTQVTEFLADQIVANQVLLAEQLENTFRQRVQNWDCDYRDHFREEAFGDDYTVVITGSDLDTVVQYVEDRLLSDLCLKADDFLEYMIDTYPDGITSYRIITGVTAYTNDALTYYFPDVDEVGLSVDDWADAQYSCRNLETQYEH